MNDPKPSVGVVVVNRLSGQKMMITGMVRTKRGRAWTLRRQGREFVCHVDQFEKRYEVIE